MIVRCICMAIAFVSASVVHLCGTNNHCGNTRSSSKRNISRQCNHTSSVLGFSLHFLLIDGKQYGQYISSILFMTKITITTTAITTTAGKCCKYQVHIIIEFRATWNQGERERARERKTTQRNKTKREKLHNCQSTYFIRINFIPDNI